MQIIRHYENCPDYARNCTLALGNFDGVHRGHQKIIKKTIDTARESDVPAAVMTFEPHPRSFFHPDDEPTRITPFHDKGVILDEFGIDILFAIHFDKKFSQISAEEFINDILVNSLKVSKVVIGHDFIFGHKRQGNAALLKEKTKSSNYELIQVDAVSENGDIYSSTKIRDFLRNGEIERANKWLGRAHFISGKIEKGEQRGRQIGCPTANIYLKDHLRLKFGVYQVKIKIEGLDSYLPAIASLGRKPTFRDNREVLEIYIFDFEKNIYGKDTKVEFYKFIRDEKKFDSVDELSSQIEQDCRQVKSLFNC